MRIDFHYHTKAVKSGEKKTSVKVNIKMHNLAKIFMYNFVHFYFPLIFLQSINSMNLFWSYSLLNL